jgi:hypothetical protein
MYPYIIETTIIVGIIWASIIFIIHQFVKGA